MIIAAQPTPSGYLSGSSSFIFHPGSNQFFGGEGLELPN